MNPEIGVKVTLVHPAECDLGDWTVAGHCDGNRISLVRLEEMGQVNGEPWFLRRVIEVPALRVHCDR